MDKPTFIKQHPSDGDLLININHIVKIKMSNDDFHASVLTKDSDVWIRTYVFYDELIKLVDLK